MKRIKKFISAVLCGTVLAATLVSPVSALTFPDVEDDPTVSWAKDAINSMTDLGYIKGYEDGTFQPQRAVSKIETLLLMARILGVEDEDYTQSVDWANSEYSATVNAINTTYVDELCFLMYFGVIDLTDLRNYASSANANTSLLRWQAAYLISKLSGRESDANQAILDPSTYSDYDSIPEEARSYVAYATNMGLMNGMGDDDNGNDYFSPETTLTRAQMATLLNRMIDKMDRYTVSGTVTYADELTYDFSLEDSSGTETDYEADSSTLVKINGAGSSFEDIEAGSEAMLTYAFGSIRMIECIPGQQETSIYGVVVQTSDNAGGQQITIRDNEDQSNTATYTFDRNCTYDIKGTRGAFGDIKIGNCVRLVLSGSAITECYVVENTFYQTGEFVEVSSGSSNTSYITIINDDGEEETLTLSTNGVDVNRNGSTSSLRELVSGDTLSLRVYYGKVTAVTATSETTDGVGTIREIVLSDSPEITLEINGRLETYSMTSNTQVKVNNVDATIYDLRPGNAATVVIDGNSIASIESSATASTGKTAAAGQVASINTTLRVITITNASGGSETIYYDANTTFLRASTGRSATAKDVVEGSNINATGSDSTGYFVATIIIVD